MSTTDEPGPANAADAGRTPLAAWLALVVILAINLAVRWPLVGMPLERDEGEFAYGGQLLLAGEAPYESLYAMKWPGIYLGYAVIEAIFGQTSEGIHRGLLLLTTINITCMFLIGRRLLGSFGAVAASTAYMSLGLSPAVEPSSTQAEHFVLLAALPAVFVLAGTWQSPRAQSWLLAGLCFGLAALVKQHGGFLALAGLIGLAWRLASRPAERPAWLLSTLNYIVALVLPLALVSVWIASRGTFGAFWYWTIEYAFVYATLDSIQPGARTFWPSLWSEVRPMWPLVAAAVWGCAAELARRPRRAAFGLVAALGVASFLSILPGREYRPHYFLLLWPAIALGVAFGLESYLRLVFGARAEAAESSASQGPLPRRADWRPAAAGAVALAVIAGWPLYNSARILLSQSHEELTRALYGADPFSQIPVYAEYLRERTSPEDRIAVLGSQPQLFFLSGRRSATGHIYLYPMLDAHRLAQSMQQDMIDEIEQARPKYFVVVRDWYIMPSTTREIFDWTELYLKAKYELVGCAVVKSPDETVMLWDEAARDHGPSMSNIVDLYRLRAR